MRTILQLPFMLVFFLLLSASLSAASTQDASQPPVLFIESLDDLPLEELPLLQEELLTTLNPEEKRWYKTFHEGALFFSGWNDITRRVVALFSEAERELKLAEMQLLGIKIGYEWCKANSERRIDNGTLREWGKELRRAVQGDVTRLTEILVKIELEMNQIINSSS
ncbi:MAG: hypothetical protein H8E79_02810 [Desulfobulbaceae bacterium]|uniref:Uncharacterized protein n=1 Tax=Candidatus Desulfatifera sulfidica TaxID=2841691 RepID=A0A8J6N5Q5_9BACT|nr:hypothetical protein [Candidatus Desulfatifera sulfidica]